MIQAICVAGFLAACVGSVCAAASSVPAPDSVVSALAGAALLSAGLLGRRKRVAAR
jgi:hypothetical protein